MFALIGYALLGIVVSLGVVSLLVLVLPGDHLGAAPRDVVPSGLPARPEIRGEDVARVRLPVTLRGYRMVDTDAILDRLAFELERRDQEIDNLRQRAGLPPREAVADFAPSSAAVEGFAPASWPLEDRARDEVLVPIGAPASGEQVAARRSFDAAEARGGHEANHSPTDLAGGSTDRTDGPTDLADGSAGAVPR
jgi:hypothetical protein